MSVQTTFQCDNCDGVSGQRDIRAIVEDRRVTLFLDPEEEIGLQPVPVMDLLGAKCVTEFVSQQIDAEYARRAADTKAGQEGT